MITLQPSNPADSFALRPLPHLRQDLALYPAPAAADGTPAWHLHDPAANRFYHLGWLAFEVVSRWSLPNPQAIVDAIKQETTLDISLESVAAVADFLERQHLFIAQDTQATARLHRAATAKQQHWAKWLLHNYLFFRIPLIRPDAWLGRLAPHIGLVFRPAFWWLLATFSLLGFIQVARQWDQFLHAFTAYTGWQALLAFGVAISCAKIAHEMGHALVAKYHGCKVPSMGVAFLVLWPMLYTDTNEAWKLRSHRARFQISLAGMAGESMVALLATWAWLLLPDGPLRAAAFFLATTSWAMTIALNASPFMRFDGYFLLVDFLGLPNLHARAFALGRWWLREKLFAWGDPVPEEFPASRRRALVSFAIITWLYRLALFLSIALLVYHTFFKLLGLLLMGIELIWFIALPLSREIEVWWTRRNQTHWNSTTRRSVSLSLITLGILALPWQGEINAPAVLGPAQEQVLYSPFAARINAYPAQEKSRVEAGELLLQLDSPELDYKLKKARIEATTRHTQLAQQAFNEKLLLQGESLRSHWQEAQAQANGLAEEEARLSLRAAFSGEIVARSAENLPSGTWVTARERLLVLADRSQSRVEAFVGERDLDRIHIGHRARFIPEAPGFSRRDCRIADIERVNLEKLEEPALASIYGGPIPSLPMGANHAQASRSFPKPTNTIYRVRLDHCSPTLAPHLRLRGVAHLDADLESPISAPIRRALATLIRESGF